MKLQLLKDQNNAITHLDKWKVGALFMDAGTGKTRVACELVGKMPVIYVCPLRTIDNAKKEASKWTDISAWQFFGIESIQQSDRVYLEALNAVDNSKFLIVDESIKIKNCQAKRTKRLLEMSKKTEYKLILNGTPFSRNLLDIWAQMEFLSPLILNMSYNQFKDTFCCYTTISKRIGYKTYEREYITGYENIDYLYSLINDYIFRCNLSLKVSKTYNKVPYIIEPAESKEYNELKEFYLKDETLLWKNNNIFIEMTQKMQHSYCCTEGKIDAVNNILKKEQNDKVIIFCKFVDSQELCKKHFPQCRVLSYQKESLGLNLQQYNCIIYFDKIWDYALKEQSSRRIFRTGQQLDCVYYELTGNIGLERMIDKNISKKISMTEYFKKISNEELKKLL